MERLCQSRTFAQRYEKASVAVVEATERSDALLAAQQTSDMPPREAARLQRRWLAMVDRYDAWSNRT